jgi:hypothetical protein
MGKTYFVERPPTPKQLLASLRNIFPDFGDGDIVQDVEESHVSLHTVVRHFNDYFGATRIEPSDRQLASLGQLLSEAVAVDDILENAVATCLLEHLHQVGRYRSLAPYLSKRTKARTRA